MTRRRSDALATDDSYWHHRAVVTNAHAARRGAPQHLDGPDLRNQWEHQQARCHWCHHDIALGTSRGGKKLATIDHITRVTDGGTNESSNIVWACKQCNSERHYWN